MSDVAYASPMVLDIITLVLILALGGYAMATLEDIRREVAESRAGVESAVTLIRGLRQQLQDLIDAGNVTPEELQTIVDDLDAQQQTLAQAVAEEPSTPNQG